MLKITDTALKTLETTPLCFLREYQIERYKDTANKIKENLETFIEKLVFTGRLYSHPDYFEIYHPTNEQPHVCITVKEGSNPSKAIKAYVNGLTLSDCTTTLTAARYQTLLKLFGENKFDAIFSSDSNTPLSFFPNSKAFNLFNETIEGINDENQVAFIKKGYDYFLSNRHLYKSKHLTGLYGGFSLVCMSTDGDGAKFTGLGLPKEGLPMDDII